MKTKTKWQSVLIGVAAILCCAISLNSFGQTPCAPPSGLNLTGISGSSATLSWTAVTGAVQYRVMYQEVGNPSANTVNTTTESVTINSLNPSSDYQWQVQTDCGNSNFSAFSAPATFSIAAISCSVPTGPNATNITATSATLAWDGMTNAASYNVQYRVYGAPSWITVNAPIKLLTLSSLVPSTQYEWQVQTDCGNSNPSAYSVPVKFNTAAIPGCNSVPTGLTTTNLTESSVVLSWATGANDAMLVGYQIQYRAVGNPTWTTITSATSSATVSSLNPATSYEWQVRSDCGNSLLSSFSTLSSYTTMSHAPVNTNANANASNMPTYIPDPNNQATWVSIIASTGNAQADAQIVHDWLLAHGCIFK